MKNLIFRLFALALVLSSCSKTDEIKPAEKPKHSGAREANFVTLSTQNFQYSEQGSSMVTTMFFTAYFPELSTGRQVELSFTPIYKTPPIVTLWGGTTVKNMDGYGSGYYQFTAPWSATAVDGVRVRARTRTDNDAEWSDYVYEKYYYYSPADYSQFHVTSLYTSSGKDYITWDYSNPQNLYMNCYVTVDKKINGNWVQVLDKHHVTGGQGSTSLSGTYQVGDPSFRDGSDIRITAEWDGRDPSRPNVPGNGRARTYAFYFN